MTVVVKDSMVIYLLFLDILIHVLLECINAKKEESKNRLKKGDIAEF